MFECTIIPYKDPGTCHSERGRILRSTPMDENASIPVGEIKNNSHISKLVDVHTLYNL